MPLAPRQPEVGEVHLALVARRSCEPPDRLHRLLRADPAYVALHLAVAAPVARRLDFVEQPHGAQLRVLRQARVNDPLVGVELRRPRGSGSVSHRLAVRPPIQLPSLDPVVYGPPADLQVPSDRRLGHPLLEVMSQKHPLLSPDHCASSVPWRRKNTEPTRKHAPNPRPSPYRPSHPVLGVCTFQRPYLCSFARPVTPVPRPWPPPLDGDSGSGGTTVQRLCSFGDSTRDWERPKAGSACDFRLCCLSIPGQHRG